MPIPPRSHGAALLAACWLSACASAPPPKPPEPPKPPPVPMPVTEQGRVEPGCFAWSEQDGVAACVVGSYSVQGGGSFRVQFLGMAAGYEDLPVGGWRRVDDALDPLAADPTMLERLRKQLQRGHFVKLARGEVVAAGQEEKFLDSGVRVRFDRQPTGTDEVTGEANEFSDFIEVMCGDTALVFASESSRDPDRALRVTALRGAKWVLLHDRQAWYMPGDQGASAQALLLDAATCAPPMAGPSGEPGDGDETEAPAGAGQDEPQVVGFGDQPPRRIPWPEK